MIWLRVGYLLNEGFKWVTLDHFAPVDRVFPRPFTHGGGGQSVNGGTHEGGT